MLDPTSLFSYERDVDSRTVRASTLIVTLGSFADSGNVQRRLNDFFERTGSKRLIGTFDADQIVDYTGVRPEVTLERDHFVDYQQPMISLLEIAPEGERPFLLLKGPEPNFQWERATSAIRIVIEQLDVTRTIVASGFPAATPHTRPVPMTRYAGNPDDLVISNPMPGNVEMRSAFPTLLTMRLAEAGHSVIGLAAHVPSYAHEMDYSPAVPALLTGIESEGGPHLTPDAKLEAEVAAARAMLDTAMQENEQLSGLIQGFEENYSRMDDAMSKLSPPQSSPIPGAEGLSDEVESFLRDVSRPDDDGED